ncbi:MAG: histidine phosphatase family protein [Caldilineaceae bacterium SB0670_bin_27]|uniref:Histidine phosphatase family protein n=1 Tax=Caldilineaceae bacterium SB0664_bin_27 TaxID=2605260 RepID=A0A6B0YZN7_9CHLR|nr:histidine phosphatase family protein [Caldilineaceae bacterium SB0664_bin_27]MYJ79046.1 histidine phosphatase family protein [Caldilineaceae bacterium SB0670_bin_27]
MKATETGRPKKLYLIAHACTRQVRNTDAALWHLNEVGRMQAAALARQPFWDEVDRLLLSCEPKTRLTVAPLLKSKDMPVEEDDRFNELHRSPEWTDDYSARVATVFRRPRESVAGWEPAADALNRIRAGIDSWAARHPDDTLALVGHGLTFSLYRAHLLGLPTVPLQDWQQLSFAAVACVQDGRIVDDFAVPPGVPHISRGAASPAVDPADEQRDSGLKEQGRPLTTPE